VQFGWTNLYRRKSETNCFWKNTKTSITTGQCTQQHDAWFVYMFLKMNDQEKSESFSNRRIVDKVIEVFWKTVRRVFQNNADICAEFNIWFSTEWDIATADVKGSVMASLAAVSTSSEALEVILKSRRIN
jgi:hypothetical protein